MSDGVIPDLSLGGFQEEISKNVASVVDFWAPWCVPCKVMAVTLSDVKKSIDSEYPGKVKFYKVNVDEEPVLAQRHGVMSLPTIVGYRGSKPVQRFQGKTKEQLKTWVRGLIGG